MSYRAPGKPDVACVNDGRVALTKCTKCQLDVCGQCCVYLVNDDPWCSSCGNIVVDETKPRWTAGAVALGAGLVLTALASAAQWKFVGRVQYLLVAFLCAGSVFV